MSSKWAHAYHIVIFFLKKQCLNGITIKVVRFSIAKIKMSKIFSCFKMILQIFKSVAYVFVHFIISIYFGI